VGEETGPRTFVGRLESQEGPMARITVPVQVTPGVEGSARHVLDTGDDALSVDLTNRSEHEVATGDLQWQAGDQSGVLEVPTLAPGETQTVTVPLAGLAEGSHEYRLELPVDGYADVVLTGTVEATDGQELAQLDHRSIQVDGALDDLSGVTGVDLAPSADGKLGGRWTTASEEAWVYGG